MTYTGRYDIQIGNIHTAQEDVISKPMAVTVSEDKPVKHSAEEGMDASISKALTVEQNGKKIITEAFAGNYTYPAVNVVV